MKGLAAQVVLALYRAALVRYPPSLRERYGADMVATAEALLREASERAGAWGSVRASARLFRDLLRPLPDLSPARRRGGGGAGPGHALRTAFRSLRRDPRFTVSVMAVVGVGLALNVLVLAAVNAYLVRPLPYPESHRLYDVRPAVGMGWMEVGDLFEKAVSWDLDAFTLVGDGDPELAWGAWVTPDFFEIYGLRPALGRALLPHEAGDGAAAVAVISHRLWRERFGGDPAVLGRSFRAFTSDRPEDAESFMVVGVLGPDAWHFNRFTDVLVPLRADQPVYAGRLRADVPPERAAEILTRTARARASEPLPEGFAVTLRPVHEAYVARARPRLLVTQAAALLVLLIACANACVLVLVRAAGRSRELAVRRALGAGRAGLLGPLLGEGLLLALGSGLIALGSASVLLPGLASVVQARLGTPVPGGVELLRVDAPVLAALVGACALIGLVLALIPLPALTRRAPLAALAGGGRGGTDSARARRLRGVLVGAELALSLTLLTGAGLLVRSALALGQEDPGFDVRGVVAANVGLRQASYPDGTSRAAFFDALVEEVGRVPGVGGATVVRAVPFLSNATLQPVEAGEDRWLEGVLPQVVHPSAFQVLGVPVLRGRGFSAEDGPGAGAVAVVDRRSAEALWPGADPLGRRIRFAEGSTGMGTGETGGWMTVVGVVGDVVTAPGQTVPVVYVPHAQDPLLWMSLVVRARPGAEVPLEGVSAALRRLDGEAPLYGGVGLEDAAARALAPSRFFAGLLGGFSVFAFLLAVLGLYAVVAYAARQQRREVAIRMALGARRVTVQGLFVRQSLVTMALALAAGAVGGRVLGRALGGQLHGVEPGDPVVGSAAVLLLGVTAILAVWLPARRASREDPMGVLREE